ncbi:hypothetical protein NCCP2716_26400 [Sporosarcina sp. NCCP-2716]|uniref:hypothetical protein n=1 Tax=Sporosarcina sp. NCCP-2716 TaxID=2943679 RepID=UPI00203DA6F4|nr:hypothetical protein [Sporosarcina sp. NCCP-2716]GKV70142.1 hypothetical protein NCCP2716_26400 [Sporosarcina sp. NCCP-2716]
MKPTSILLAGIVLVLGIFSLISRNPLAFTYMEVAVSILFLCLGILQFRERRKTIGTLLVAAGGFDLFASLYPYL